jgi:phosphoribosyl-dephospho-CoA transferase
MNEVPLRRHDLVWLDPAIDAGVFASAEQAEHARSWVQQGRPLVVARQSEPATKQEDLLNLGFTLPSAPVRTRISLRAPRAAIIRHTRPLLLPDAIGHAPHNWRDGMSSLHDLCTKAGAVARVYGSLSSQAYTGEIYVDAASDLDLLLECRADTKLDELLAALESIPLQALRIDGEILAQSGWAVAWRELAAALRSVAPCKVLAKSDRDARLIPLEQFFAAQLALAI